VSKSEHSWLDNVYGYTFGKPPIIHWPDESLPESLWMKELRSPDTLRDKAGYPQLPELLRCVQTLKPELTESIFSEAIYLSSVYYLAEDIFYTGGRLNKTVMYDLLLPEVEDRGIPRAILSSMASRGAEKLGLNVQIENEWTRGKPAVIAWVAAMHLALVAAWWHDEPELVTGLPTLDRLLKETQDAIREGRIGRPATLELMRRRRLVQEFSWKYDRPNTVSIGVDRNVETLLLPENAGYMIDPDELEDVYKKSNRVRD